MLSLVAGLIVAYGPEARRSWRAILGIVTLIGAGAFTFTLGPLQQVLAYRLQQSAIDYSVGERMELYTLAWSEFVRHPVLGIGLNNFSVSAHRLTGVDTVPHNFALGFLAELGGVGLFLALAVCATMLVEAWRARAGAPTGADRSLGLALWAAFVAAALHNLIESTIYGEQFKILLVLCAVATARLAAGWNAPAQSSLHAPRIIPETH
jgi:O-antigen ligase